MTNFKMTVRADSAVLHKVPTLNLDNPETPL